MQKNIKKRDPPCGNNISTKFIVQIQWRNSLRDSGISKNSQALYMGNTSSTFHCKYHSGTQSACSQAHEENRFL